MRDLADLAYVTRLAFHADANQFRTEIREMTRGEGAAPARTATEAEMAAMEIGHTMADPTS
jgi:hypothetical protein